MIWWGRLRIRRRGSQIGLHQKKKIIFLGFLRRTLGHYFGEIILHYSSYLCGILCLTFFYVVRLVSYIFLKKPCSILNAIQSRPKVCRQLLINFISINHFVAACPRTTIPSVPSVPPCFSTWQAVSPFKINKIRTRLLYGCVRIVKSSSWMLQRIHRSSSGPKWDWTVSTNLNS